MKKLKIIFAGLIFSLFVTNTFASTIDAIEAISNKAITVTASPDVVFSDIKVYGDVKVLRDLNIVDVILGNISSKNITLSLGSDLSLNSNYTIIGVGGAEGSIEFSLGDTFPLEVKNPNYLNEEKIIEKAVVLDSRTIELSYNYDIVSLNYDIKILNELALEDMYSIGNNILEIKLDTPLEKSSSYILMISSLEDAYGREIIFDEILYDFFTSNTLLSENTEVEEGINEEIISIENIDENEGNLEKLALNSAKTPETGAKAWIVLVFAILLASFLLFKTKKTS